MPTQIEIQNALRVLGTAIKQGELTFHGNDLMELKTKGRQPTFILRSQDLAPVILDQQNFEQ